LRNKSIGGRTEDIKILSFTINSNEVSYDFCKFSYSKCFKENRSCWR